MAVLIQTLWRLRVDVIWGNTGSRTRLLLIRDNCMSSFFTCFSVHFSVAALESTRIAQFYRKYPQSRGYTYLGLTKRGSDLKWARNHIYIYIYASIVRLFVCSLWTPTVKRQISTEIGTHTRHAYLAHAVEGLGKKLGGGSPFEVPSLRWNAGADLGFLKRGGWRFSVNPAHQYESHIDVLCVRASAAQMLPGFLRNSVANRYKRLC